MAIYPKPKYADDDDLLFTANDPAMIESGIVKSLHPLQAPLWIDGANVIFTDKAVRKAPGYQQICPPGGSYPVRGIHDVLSNGIPELVFGDLSQLYSIEGARTNLSPNLNNWSSINASVTSTNNIAHDGAPVATLYHATNTTMLLDTPCTLVAGAVYTLSVYAKSAPTNDYGSIRLFLGNAPDIWVSADLVNGRVASTFSDDPLNVFVGASVVPAGNGWYRVSVSGSLNPAYTVLQNLIELPATNAGHTDILLAYPQFERGSVATDYIATTTIAVKAADLPLSSASVVVAGTGYTSDMWSMESWGNFAVASNGSDNIQINKFNGSGFTRLLGSPPKAKIIMRSQIFMLAIGTSQNSDNTYNINGDATVVGPSFFSFCDVDNIEQWLANTGQSQAGAQNIRDLDSGIIAAAPLGGPIAVYSGNTMALINYIGTPFWFGYSVALRGFGPVGQFAVVARERQNYGFGRDGIWTTDGNSFNYIDPPDIRKYLQDNVNWSYAWKTNGFLNERRNMIEFSYPKVGSTEPNETACYCYENGKFSFKPYGRTAGLAKNIFSNPITVGATGNVYWNEYGLDADRQPMVSFIQSKPLHCDQRMYWKTVSNINVQMKELLGTSTRIYLGVQETLNDAITWLTPQNLSMSSAPLYFQNGDGVFLTIKVVSDALGDDWALSGFDIYGNLNGQIQ